MSSALAAAGSRLHFIFSLRSLFLLRLVLAIVESLTFWLELVIDRQALLFIESCGLLSISCSKRLCISRCLVIWQMLESCICHIDILVLLLLVILLLTGLFNLTILSIPFLKHVAHLIFRACPSLLAATASVCLFLLFALLTLVILLLGCRRGVFSGDVLLGLVIRLILFFAHHCVRLCVGVRVLGIGILCVLSPSGFILSNVFISILCSFVLII
ncbi:hypothetical protein KC324_g59 [Hortaea werneckii]|nr:hypothetical protein KC324_g59 [Hortaea werneckii]